MHWESGTTVADLVGPGWHPDPLNPTRLRWWDGTTWSARIARLEAGSDGISWHADVVGLAPPTPRTAAPPMAIANDFVEPPPPAPRAAVAETWTPTPTPPAAAELLPEVEVEGPSRAHPRRNRRAWAMLGAAVLILGAGAGAGTAMLSGGQRPTVADRITYRDDAADFALQYPAEWQIDKRTPGEKVLFVIGARDAGAGEQNTVSVNAGTSSGQPLPALHLLVTQTADDLTAQHPGFRLVSASEDRLAHAPAYRFEFIDNTTRPSERLVELVGRTTSGRPLIVVMTVREPRTAPTDEELQQFLASITSS